MTTYVLSKYNVIIKETNNKMLIFNSRNQALCWIDSDIYSNIISCSASELSRLISLGLVVDEKKDEYGELLFEKKYFIYNANPSQVGFVIAPTLLCNMRCKYCFENGVDDKSIMTIQVADEIIEFIKKQLDSNGLVQRLHIRWFGGEPCLAIDIIEYISKQLLAYCDSKRIMYNSMMVSNGLLLDKEMAYRMSLLHIGRVQITIDGMGENYASAKGVNKECLFKVVDNVCEICDLVKVIIRINITEDNIEDMEALARYLLIEKNLNGKIWIYYELVRNFGQNEKKNMLTAYDFEIEKAKVIKSLIEEGCIDSLLHDLPRKNLFSCGAMQCKSATIGPYGELYRCDNSLGKSEFIIGDSKKGFYRNRADLLFLDAKYKKKCQTCSMLPICGGGCIHDRIIEKNDKSCRAVRQRLINDVNVYLKYLERRKKDE